MSAYPMTNPCPSCGGGPLFSLHDDDGAVGMLACAGCGAEHDVGMEPGAVGGPDARPPLRVSVSDGPGAWKEVPDAVSPEAGSASLAAAGGSLAVSPEAVEAAERAIDDAHHCPGYRRDCCVTAGSVEAWAEVAIIAAAPHLHDGCVPAEALRDVLARCRHEAREALNRSQLEAFGMHRVIAAVEALLKGRSDG